MDLRLIQKLLRMMSRADVTELEIDDSNEGLKVRLRRGNVDVPAAPVVHFMGGGAPSPAAVAAPPSALGAPPEEARAAELPLGAKQILSPMVGTFYRSSSPDAAPFVEIGGRVGSEDVICIIEAMKVMNEIKAEVSGEILEALVENGEPVEFGQPLFLVKTA